MATVTGRMSSGAFRPEEWETLRRQRLPVRRGFSKALDELEAELESENKTKVSIQQLYNRASIQRENLALLDRKIDHAMVVVKATDDEMDEEYSTVTEFSNRFSDVDVRVHEYFDFFQYDTESVGSVRREMAGKNQYRLPKLEFKKFGGDAKEWLGFWSQFKAIHNDDSMAEQDKFQYLIQATTDGSKAREVVDSFPASPENYPKVIQYLKERFGKDEILVEVYVRELLRLVLKNALSTKEQTSILNLYDKLETQLRALETLGVTSDKFASMLYPLVESCLPEETIRTWERNRGEVDGGKGAKDRLSMLMEFLKREVDGEIRISMARSGFGVEQEKKLKAKAQKKPDEDVATATDLFNAQVPKKPPCIFCDKNHNSSDCFKAPKMKLEEKQKMIQEKKVCFVCLKPGHISKKCKASVRCQVCEKKHFVCMCPQLNTSKAESKPSQPEGTVLANQCSMKPVMLQTLLVRVSGPNGEKIVRALVDTGSMKSYLSEKAVKILGLKANEQLMIAHCVFGGGQSNAKVHGVYKVIVKSLNNNYSCALTVLDQPIICGKIPRIEDLAVIRELRAAGVDVTDVGEGNPDVHLLIGADVAGSLFTGKIVPSKLGPVAVETKLGWTVMGKLSPCIPTSDSTLLVTSMISNDAQICDLWTLDAIGIRDVATTQSRLDLEESAMKYFEKTTKRLQDGRFEVSLPWIEGHPVLESNQEIATKRLATATKKLEDLGRYDEYDRVFKTWIEEGIIEEVPEEEIYNSGHYLPHRAVIKESSQTTKIRPVFDASAKPKGGVSLNECLEKGRNLLELIPKLVLGFRLYQIGIISDIEKAFLQISVKREERDFLRFLWWEKGSKKMKILRHCRVVFGISSSPFLLAATLKMLLESVPEDVKDIAEKLRKSLYVDNCVTSLKSIGAVESFICDSMQLMSEGQFNLRGWVWNDPERANEENPVNSVPVLGLLWNVSQDELQLDLRDVPDEKDTLVTKRKILSLAHKLFDPIGFSCPVSLYPKLLLRETWKLKVGWDTELPEELREKFVAWREQLMVLKEVTIPRWIFGARTERSNWTLHIFTDASKEAYAAAVFLRADTVSGISVQLLQAKSRVAPLKEVTIPRLELLGCCIGARLCSTVRKDLEYSDIRCYFWTDSSNALSWIQRQEEWATFVGNRVKEIRQLTNVEDWRHIPGQKNPADLPSRGCSPKFLLKSKWWEGPDWLRYSSELWPNSVVNAEESIVASERKKTVSSHLVTSSETPWYVIHFSKYFQIVRMFGWIKRYIHNSLNKNSRRSGELNTSEIKDGELLLIRLIQCEVFKPGRDKKGDLLNQLNAEKDFNGIWRLKTKIFRRDDLSLFKSPILLPGDHKIVHLLILQVHWDSCHAGVQVVMGILREKYWICRARKTIKSVLTQCKVCCRFDGRKFEVNSPPLPVNRVRDAAVFEVVGVDLAGPLYLKGSLKGWVVIFTCAVYRAVHFELVSSVSTENFLQSFRRFISRRGRPSTVYSDNATNFTGADNLWKKINWEEVSKSSYGSSHALKPIVWIFNPPSAPWWGGWWERIVRMLKQILRKVLGRACLDFEELMTILCDCEYVINSRPLTYVSDDQRDLVPLTPSMFLRDIGEDGVPDLDQIDEISLNKRLLYRKKVRIDLRKRFRVEYLGLLLLKRKKMRMQEVIKPGDIVLVGSDNSKRIDWPLAKVLEVFPGSDGVVRVARVKTAFGVLLRPIQRLYPFELNSADRKEFLPAKEVNQEEDYDAEVIKAVEDHDVRETQVPVVDLAKKTRLGRLINPPKRFE